MPSLIALFVTDTVRCCTCAISPCGSVQLNVQILLNQRQSVSAGLWQTPSLPLHPTGCAHRQGIIIARGFLETVATQFSLKPFTFMSSMRLGQPMLVLVLEATVKHEDVRPSQAGFAKGEFMWASQMQYADLHDQISQVRLPQF